MTDKAKLNITWGRAYGDIYCHSAVLAAPYNAWSLFVPQTVKIGVRTRTNIIDKGYVADVRDKECFFYLPCECNDGELIIPLDSLEILEALSLHSRTTKGGRRGILREFPTAIFYHIEDEEEKVLPFDFRNDRIPYDLSEELIASLKDGETGTVSIELG